jgi:hypothetical protein
MPRPESAKIGVFDSRGRQRRYWSRVKIRVSMDYVVAFVGVVVVRVWV